jgi:rubrerythrin
MIPSQKTYPAIFSNLAKASEKQQREETAQLFRQLSQITQARTGIEAVNESAAGTQTQARTRIETKIENDAKNEAPGATGEGSAEASLTAVRQRITQDLETHYPQLQQLAEAANDRGAQRALKWAQKVTTLQKSLIDRYLLKGEALMADSSLFVCEACGFIFLGKAAPEICPVCKAPAKRFSKVS